MHLTYNHAHISLMFTFQMVRYKQKSRFRAVKKWKLWLGTAHNRESIDDGRGCALLQVTKHWKGSHRHRLPQWWQLSGELKHLIVIGLPIIIVRTHMHVQLLNVASSDIYTNLINFSSLSSEAKQ